jgi:hypothetical protein
MKGTVSTGNYKISYKGESFYISYEFLNQNFSRQKFYNSRNVRFRPEILKFSEKT